MIELSLLNMLDEILGVVDSLGINVDSIRTSVQEKINGILTDLGMEQEYTANFTEPFKVNAHMTGIALNLNPGDLTPEGVIATGNENFDKALKDNINQAILNLSDEDRAGYVATLESIGVNIAALNLSEEAIALLPTQLQTQLQAAASAIVTPTPIQTNVFLETSQPNAADTIAAINADMQASLDPMLFPLSVEVDVTGRVVNFELQGMPTTMEGTLPSGMFSSHQTGGKAAYTGLHYLHQGEEVLTRNEAQRYRAGQYGGGGNNINIYGV